MVTLYGMSEKFGMVQLEGVTGQYLDGQTYLQCSDETATKVDTEVRNIIKRSYNKAYKLLKKNLPILDAIAEHLIEKETITGQEFMEIFNQVGKEKGVITEEEKLKPAIEPYEKKEALKKADGDKVETPTVETPVAEAQAAETPVTDTVSDKVPEQEKTPEQKEERMPMPWETFVSNEKPKQEEPASEQDQNENENDDTENE